MNEQIVLYTETLDDQERARIALESRIRSMKEYGLQDDLLDQLLISISTLEQEAEKALKKHLRSLPLYPWIKNQVGLGEKQVGRLLGAIGNPYLRPIFDDDGNLIDEVPRTVGQLWSYCGYAVEKEEAPRRRKGIQAKWNDTAKMRVRLISESCIKQSHSPYRIIYDSARAKYQNALHPLDCPRCGPSGRPALKGSPLSDGHKHARALRIVSKEILKDLWVESKNLYEFV